MLINLPAFTLTPDVLRHLHDARETDITLADLDQTRDWLAFDPDSAIRCHEDRPFEFVLYGVVAQNDLFPSRHQPSNTPCKIEIFPLHREDAIHARSLFNTIAEAAARDPDNYHVPIPAEVILEQDRPTNIVRPDLLLMRGRCIQTLDGTNLRLHPSEHPVLHPATILPGDVVKLNANLILRSPPTVRPDYCVNIVSLTLMCRAPDLSIPDLRDLVYAARSAPL